jgi:hypothetical protein
LHVHVLPKRNAVEQSQLRPAGLFIRNLVLF